jgi:hypothetical protein
MNHPNPPGPIKPHPWFSFPTLRRLFRWRTLRTLLFALVCLVTLIALFYAEENWRGQRAWDKFKRECAAKGEQVGWQALVPPAVPDDENFAMTPLLKPILDYEPGVAGARGALWRDTNGVNRIWQLNVHPRGVTANPPELVGDWRRGKITDLAAWQSYFRGTSAPPGRPGGPAPPSTNIFPVAAEPSTPAADVLLALTRFDAELAELKAASARPYARFPVHYGEGFGTLLPHLAILKGISRLVTLRAVAELEAGRNEQAFQDVRLSFHLADGIKTEPICISHLVRLAIVDQTMQAVWEGLAAHRWSSNQVGALMNYLQPMELLADYPRLLRSDTSGGGFRDFADRQSLRAFLRSALPSSAISPGFVEIFSHCPRGWLYLNDLTATRFHREKMLPAINPAEQRAYPDRARTAAREFEEAKTGPANFAVKEFGVWIVPERFARGQTHANLALVACALEQYWQAHREYPEALAALVPTCLAKLPGDLITGQPLVYRRTGDGQFVLYSVGWDQTDNSGAFPAEPLVNLARRGFRNFTEDPEEKGDWIWRYPARKD